MFQRKHHTPPTLRVHSPVDDLKETSINNIYFGKQLYLPKTNKTSVFTEIITWKKVGDNTVHAYNLTSLYFW